MTESDKKAAEHYKTSKDFYKSTSQYLNDLVEETAKTSNSIIQIENILDTFVTKSKEAESKLVSQRGTQDNPLYVVFGKSSLESIVAKLELSASGDLTEFLKSLEDIDDKTIEKFSKVTKSLEELFTTENSEKAESILDTVKAVSEKFSSAAKIETAKAESIENTSRLILTLTGSILAMGAGIMLLGPANILSGAAIVTGSVALLVTAMNRLNKQDFDLTTFTDFSLGLSIILGSFGLIGVLTTFMSPAAWIATVGVLSGVSFGLVSTVKYIHEEMKRMKDVGTTMLTLSTGVGILSGSFIALALSMKVISFEEGLAAITTLGIAAGIMVGLTRFINEQKIETQVFNDLATAVGILSASIIGTAIAMKVLSFQEIGESVVVLVAAAGALIGLSWFMNRANIKTEGFIQIATSVAILSGTFIGLHLALTLIGTDELWNTLLAFTAITAGAVGLMVLIGQFGSQIRSGAVSNLVLTASLLASAGGFMLASRMMNNVSAENMFSLLGYTAMFGLGFAALGIPPVAALVGLGAAVVAGMGASLIVFSIALSRLDDNVASIDNERISDMGRMMRRFGLHFSSLALLAAPILIGSVALGIMSASLIMFSSSLSRLDSIKRFREDDFEKLRDIVRNTYRAIELPLVVGRRGDGPDGEGRGPSLRTVMAGSVGMLSVSLGIMGLLPTLNRVRNQNYSEDDLDGFVGIVSKLSNVLGKLGSGEGRVLGLFGRSDMERGVAVLNDLGGGVESVLKGIKHAGGIEVTDDEWQNIAEIIGRIPSIFSEFDRDGEVSFAGIRFRKSETEKGIDAVQGMGEELLNIVTAIKKAGNIPDMGDPSDPNSRWGRIAQMIGMIPGMFSDMGSGRSEFLGFTVRSSDTEKGIRTAQRIFGDLQEIFDDFSAIEVPRSGTDSSVFDSINTLNSTLTNLSEVGDRVSIRTLQSIFGDLQEIFDDFSAIEVPTSGPDSSAFDSINTLNSTLTNLGQVADRGSIRTVQRDIVFLSSAKGPLESLNSTLRTFNDELERTSTLIRSLRDDDSKILELGVKELVVSPRERVEEEREPRSDTAVTTEVAQTSSPALEQKLDRMIFLMEQLLQVSSASLPTLSSNTSRANNLLASIRNEAGRKMD